MRTQGERDVVTRMNDGWGARFGLVMIRIGFSKIPCIGQALGRSFYCFFFMFVGNFVVCQRWVFST